MVGVLISMVVTIAHVKTGMRWQVMEKRALVCLLEAIDELVSFVYILESHRCF